MLREAVFDLNWLCGRTRILDALVFFVRGIEVFSALSLLLIPGPSGPGFFLQILTGFNGGYIFTIESGLEGVFSRLPSGSARAPF